MFLSLFWWWQEFRIMCVMLCWNVLFCWGKKEKESPHHKRKNVDYTTVFLLLAFWKLLCFTLKHFKKSASPFSVFLLSSPTQLFWNPRFYLLVHFTLSLQILPADELVGDLLYSSPGIIVLLLVHLPKTALCESAGGVRHVGHVVTAGEGGWGHFNELPVDQTAGKPYFLHKTPVWWSL